MKNVLLGLSGGADSMSLLYILRDLQSEYGFTLEAAHVHHGLRGDEADRDEAFVRKICAEWDIPLHVLHADIRAESIRTGEGEEACGRRVRYAYFQSLAKGEIATAHTMSDHAETVLQHLSRGSGIRGLCGIAPVRDNIIRPLIECTREDVEQFCKTESIPYISDSSNDSDDYTRNLIRHHAVPALKKAYPGVESAIERCSALLRQDSDFVDVCAQKLLEECKWPFGYDVQTLLDAHPALRSRAVASVLRQYMSNEPQMHHIRLCEQLLQTGGAVQTEENVTVCAYGGILYVRKPCSDSWIAPVQNGIADLPFGYAKIEIIETEKLQPVHKVYLANCLCCDTIGDDVYFRSRQPGDAMTRVNSGCRKSAKKIMEELRIPASFRNDIPILTDGSRVLWMEGAGCDAEFMVTPQSRKIMRIQIIREEEE